jgi:hypothetical protein
VVQFSGSTIEVLRLGLWQAAAPLTLETNEGGQFLGMPEPEHTAIVQITGAINQDSVYPALVWDLRGRDLPTSTAAVTINRIDRDALADARRLTECRQYMAAAAEQDKLARAAQAARANLEFAEAQLNVLLHEDEGDDLPQRKILVEQEITRRKAAVAKAEQLEKSAAAITQARRQAALDALGREHNLTAARASRAAAARLNELAKVIAEKCGPELLEMAAAMATWDGLGIAVSAPRRPSHTALMMRLEDDALGAPWAKPQAVPEAKVKAAAAPATATATA